MTTVHGGRSKITTICKRERKSKKKTTPVIVEYCSALSKSNEGWMPKISSPRRMEPITIKANYVLLGGLEINWKMWLSSDADVNFHKSRPKSLFGTEIIHGSREYKDFPWISKCKKFSVLFWMPGLISHVLRYIVNTSWCLFTFLMKKWILLSCTNFKYEDNLWAQYHVYVIMFGTRLPTTEWEKTFNHGDVSTFVR